MVYEMERSEDEVEVAGMNVGYVRVSAVGVVDWYVDEHMSGASLDRPALQ